MVALPKKSASINCSCNSLIQGSVIYGRIDLFTSTAPHFFVVLNSSPSDSSEIVLIPGTSQIEKAKSRVRTMKQSQDTLLILDHKDFSPFRMQTALDCNSPFVQERSYIELLFVRQDLVLMGALDVGIVKKLVNGFIVSDKTEVKYHKLVL